jgi:hypothetical protein
MIGMHHTSLRRCLANFLPGMAAILLIFASWVLESQVLDQKGIHTHTHTHTLSLSLSLSLSHTHKENGREAGPGGTCL